MKIYFVRDKHLQLKKLFYYLSNSLALLIPKFIFRVLLSREISKVNNFNKSYIKKRLKYYIGLTNDFSISSEALTVNDLWKNQLIVFYENVVKKKSKKKRTTYFFDLNEYFRYFPAQVRLDYKFGDITSNFNTPTIVKSRPILASKNSIILNLNKIRHFHFVKDKNQFKDKINRAVWRGNSNNSKSRKYFISNFQHVELFDIGQHGPKVDKPWYKGFMPIEQQLKYKFIFCIEGADTATNMKWVMNSNSVCVMPKPKYETWFMEGTLISDFHYIEVNDDFSNAEKKISYYLRNENKCLKIIQNANLFANQFKNQKREKLISILVLDKYFKLSNQL